jgi:hypothetical protein
MSAKLRRLSLGLAASLLAISTAAVAEPTNIYSPADTGPSPEAMTADLVVVRPLGFVATLVGGVVFVIGLPIEAATGNFSGPANALVTRPAKFTFERPIGEMH